MVGFNPYAAGQKVYRGGSSAAHSGGGLDPMGYIDREINNDQSQRRSGFAQAALARMGQGGMGGQDKKKKKKVQPKKKLPAKGNNQRPGANEIAEDTMGSIRTPVISNATGQLTLDPDIMQDAADAEFAYNNNRITLDNAASDLEQQYGVAQRDVGKQQADDQRMDTNRFASRGMAFSSGYGQEVADSATAFQNAFSNLLMQRDSGLRDIGQQRLSNDQFLTGARQRLANSQAALNTQNAGTLGLAPVPQRAQQQVVNNRPQLSKAAFLQNHPKLASLRGKDRERFLKNHPEIAKAFARYQ